MTTLKPKSLLFPLLLVFYEIGGYLSNDMYLPGLPAIMSDLHVTHAQAQMTLTSWFLGSASMQLIMGPLSDRYGRRPVVLLSCLLYIITTAICAMTNDITTLLIVRFIQGITVSAVLVAGYASIHELYDHTHAIRILALMGSVVIIAPAFGPLIGSIILNFTSWRWIFWIIMIWAIVATICLAKWMPESHPLENRQPISLKFLAKSYYSIVTNWQFTGLALTFCFTFCGFIAWLTAGPFIVVDEFKKDVILFGIFQTLVFGSYIISNQLVKKLIEKHSLTNLIRFGMLTTLTGGILTAILALLFPNFLAGLIIGMMIFSFGSGFTFAPLNRLTIETSKEPMGMRMAMMNSYMTTFGVIGSILGSVFYNGTLASLGLVLAFLSLSAFLIKLSVKSKAAVH